MPGFHTQINSARTTANSGAEGRLKVDAAGGPGKKKKKKAILKRMIRKSY